MRKNILISTTRQWNPGDEFIMQGALNIMDEIMGKNYNPIIFNRNPDVRGGDNFRNLTRKYSFTYKWDSCSFKGKGGLHELFRIGHYDNSWKDDMNPNNIDIALFAGSPEWYGTRLRQMFQVIDANNIPTFFLGLGAGDSVNFKDSDSIVHRVLRSAKLITTRDQSTENLLHEYGAIYIPCPALLAAGTNRIVKDVREIGLIYATDKTLKGNNVSTEMHKYILSLYPELMKRYHCSLVCHYIDELDQARKEFPDVEIYYSYDSKDYSEIYNNFDLVVGGRVHGIGMSASLGIPGIMIKHDSRSSTTDGFLAESVAVGTEIQEVIRLIDKQSLRIEEYSAKLIEHKNNVMTQYIDLFKAKASDLFFTNEANSENICK